GFAVRAYSARERDFHSLVRGVRLWEQKCSRFILIRNGRPRFQPTVPDLRPLLQRRNFRRCQNPAEGRRGPSAHPWITPDQTPGFRISEVAAALRGAGWLSMSDLRRTAPLLPGVRMRTPESC